MSLSKRTISFVVGTVFLLGFFAYARIRASQAKSAGIEQARAACVERLDEEQCKLNLELHADACFAETWKELTFRRRTFDLGRRVRGGTLDQASFSECIILTPEVWLQERQANRGTAADHGTNPSP